MEAQSCRLQGPSLIVSIGPQEKSHPSKVHLQSDGKKAKACCWIHGPGFGDQRDGWSAGVVLGPRSCKEPGFNFDVSLKLGLQSTCECEMVKEPGHITLEEGHSG